MSTSINKSVAAFYSREEGTKSLLVLKSKDGKKGVNETIGGFFWHEIKGTLYTFESEAEAIEEYNKY